eukprot:3940898-Rhodomonas_salina.2
MVLQAPLRITYAYLIATRPTVLGYTRMAVLSYTRMAVLSCSRRVVLSDTRMAVLSDTRMAVPGIAVGAATYGFFMLCEGFMVLSYAMSYPCRPTALSHCPTVCCYGVLCGVLQYCDMRCPVLT